MECKSDRLISGQGIGTLVFRDIRMGAKPRDFGLEKMTSEIDLAPELLRFQGIVFGMQGVGRITPELK